MISHTSHADLGVTHATSTHDAAIAASTIVDIANTGPEVDSPELASVDATASNAQWVEVITASPRQTAVIAPTGTTARPKRMAGKQSIGNTSVTCDVLAAAADAHRPSASPAAESRVSTAVTFASLFPSAPPMRPIATSTVTIIVLTIASTGSSFATFEAR